MKQQTKIYIACFLCGAFSTLALPPVSVWGILFATISLFMACLCEAKTRKSLFGVGFWFGAGLGSTSMLWVINALLIDAAAFGWLVPFVPIGFGLFFGLFYGLPALFCLKTNKTLSRILTYAAWFGLFEWVRSWIFTGFPWNPLGSVWVGFDSVMQIAALCGVYGLSMLTIVWCSSIFVLSKNIKIGTILLIFFGFAVLLGYMRLEQGILEQKNVWGVNLRLVQANIPQQLKWSKEVAEENFLKHIRLSKKEGMDKITHTFWPEAATSYFLADDEGARAMVISALSQGGTLVSGTLRLTGDEKKPIANSIVQIDDMGLAHHHYDKSHLVPFGEYVPFGDVLPIRKIVPLGYDFYEGDDVKTLSVLNTYPAGFLVCYEIIFSGRVVDKKVRPSWLINATNDGWYGDSFGPYQHLAAAQMRAVEEGLPIVRTAGTGISAVINPYGQIQDFIPLNTEGVLDATLPQSINITPFGKYGNKIPLLLSALLMYLGMFYFKKKC